MAMTRTDIAKGPPSVVPSREQSAVPSIYKQFSFISLDVDKVRGIYTYTTA